MSQRDRSSLGSSRRRRGVLGASFAVLGGSLALFACGGEDEPRATVPAPSADEAVEREPTAPTLEAPAAPPLFGAGDPLRDPDLGAGCSGMRCRLPECADDATTTIVGTVYDPSGRLPLYNATVYVPNRELQPLPQGAGCSCEVSGEPITSAITDARGRFVLEGAPAGEDVPLVIQIGKWRRRVTLPSVSACGQNVVPDGALTLPKNRREGDLPRIALTTGNADALECLLRKLGIDDSEFTTPAGGGAVNFFAGHDGTARYAASMNEGAAFPRAAELWSSVQSLSRYDVVLLSCEGSEYPSEKGPSAFEAMSRYADLGGRVFASHWHQVWLKQGPAPAPEIADFVNEADLDVITADVVTTFPKGQALAEWLHNVGASTQRGKIDIERAQYTISRENPRYAQRWIHNADPPTVQYLSANTPLDAAPEAQCGRVVLSDLHVSGGNTGGEVSLDVSDADLAYPEGCGSTALSAQEKVLAFMLFDISACVVPDSEPPAPPPTVLVR